MKEKDKGIVLWYNPEKRYGFIRKDGVDFFFHEMMIVDEIPNSGDIVLFIAREIAGRMSAFEVEVLKDE